MEADTREQIVPGAFPEIPEPDGNHADPTPPPSRQPRRKFVGRRTAEAQARQKAENDPNRSVERDDGDVAIRKVPTTESPEPNPRGHPSRQGHQRSHRSPPGELFFRNPQNNPPHPLSGLYTDRSTVPRRSSPLRHDHQRHSLLILPRHRISDNGRRNVRRLLHRRLHGPRPRLRPTDPLRPQLPDPGVQGKNRHALHLRRHRHRRGPPPRHADAKLPSGHHPRHGLDRPIQQHAAHHPAATRSRRPLHPHPPNLPAQQRRSPRLHRPTHRPANLRPHPSTPPRALGRQRQRQTPSSTSATAASTSKRR